MVVAIVEGAFKEALVLLYTHVTITIEQHSSKTRRTGIIQHASANHASGLTGCLSSHARRTLSTKAKDSEALCTTTVASR